MSPTALIFVLCLVIVGLWAVMAYNRLVTLRNRIANAFAQIDVQLKRRHDLVPNLVEVARGYLQHEASTLQAVVAARGQAVQAAHSARSQPLNAAHLGALAAAESALGSGLGRLLAVAESYPELQANEQMRALHEELTSTENRIGFARQAFNDQVLEFNDAATQFPALIVARLLGFTPATMLQATHSEAERAPPRVQF